MHTRTGFQYSAKTTFAAFFCAIALLALVWPRSSAAQDCGPRWLPGESGPGVGFITNTAARLSDGGVVVGGGFSVAGGVAANCIARWDGARWWALGDGFANAIVNAVAGLLNGDIIAAGTFTSSGSTSLSRIARWNGQAWVPMGQGSSSEVRCIAVLPNGHVVANGNFVSAGGQTAPQIAEWDGTSWHAMAGGPGGILYAMTALPNGDVLVGGSGTGGLRQWDGSSWRSTTPGLSGTVYALDVLPNGEIVVGGEFGILHFDGTAWQQFGSGIAGTVYGFTRMPNGNIIAVGTFASAGGQPAAKAAMWDGSEWRAMGLGLTGGTSQYGKCVLAMPDGTAWIGGKFEFAGQFRTPNLALWKDGDWQVTGQGFSSHVYSLGTFPNGDVIAGGRFASVAGQIANCVAMQSRGSWAPLESGVSGSTSDVFEVMSTATTPAGDAIVGGTFLNAGELLVNGIAQWTHDTWQPMSGGLSDEWGPSAYCVTVMPNGNIIAGGDFGSQYTSERRNIARWDGVQWNSMGYGTNSTVRTVTAAPNGDLVAGGGFTSPGSRIARWNGSMWSPIGLGFNGWVYATAFTQNGDLLAGGEFTASGSRTVTGIALWNGSQWLPLGAGLSGTYYPGVWALCSLPNGDIIAGGEFVALVRVKEWVKE